MKEKWTIYQIKYFEKALAGELGKGEKMLNELMSIFPEGRYTKDSLKTMISAVRKGKRNPPWREYQNTKIFRLAKKGYSNKSIAKQCDISSRTVSIVISKMRSQGHIIPHSTYRKK